MKPPEILPPSTTEEDAEHHVDQYLVEKATETKQELMRCVYQNYYNILSLPSINISGNIWGLFQSGIRPTQPFTAFELTDRSGILSVTGKSYLIGNGSIDYIDNTISATLLETSDTDITATITDTVILKQ